MHVYMYPLKVLCDRYLNIFTLCFEKYTKRTKTRSNFLTTMSGGKHVACRSATSEQNLECSTTMYHEFLVSQLNG